MIFLFIIFKECVRQKIDTNFKTKFTDIPGKSVPPFTWLL